MPECSVLRPKPQQAIFQMGTTSRSKRITFCCTFPGIRHLVLSPPSSERTCSSCQLMP